MMGAAGQYFHIGEVGRPDISPTASAVRLSPADRAWLRIIAARTE